MPRDNVRRQLRHHRDLRLIEVEPLPSHQGQFVLFWRRIAQIHNLDADGTGVDQPVPLPVTAPGVPSSALLRHQLVHLVGHAQQSGIRHQIMRTGPVLALREHFQRQGIGHGGVMENQVAHPGILILGKQTSVYPIAFGCSRRAGACRTQYAGRQRRQQGQGPRPTQNVSSTDHFPFNLIVKYARGHFSGTRCTGRVF